jgi:hypothetical protein
VTDLSPAALATCRLRFAFDPGATLTAGKAMVVLAGRSGSAALIFAIQLRRSGGGAPEIRLKVKRAGGMSTSAWRALGGGGHVLELAWSAAQNASVTLLVDGAAGPSLTGLNTSGLALEAIRLGPSDGLASGAGGTLRFDRFVATRTSPIGP